MFKYPGYYATGLDFEDEDVSFVLEDMDIHFYNSGGVDKDFFRDVYDEF